jgi:hypothetical protein
MGLSFCPLTKETQSVMKSSAIKPGRRTPMNRQTAELRDVPEQVSMLDEFASRVRNANVHASLILARLSGVGDRAFGPQPEAGPTDEKVGISQEGAVDRVFCALGDLDATLARLEHAENRIHGLA